MKLYKKHKKHGLTLNSYEIILIFKKNILKDILFLTQDSN